MLRCCERCLTVFILVADDLKTFITRLYRVKHLAYVTLRPPAVWGFNVYWRWQRLISSSAWQRQIGSDVMSRASLALIYASLPLSWCLCACRNAPAWEATPFRGRSWLACLTEKWEGDKFHMQNGAKQETKFGRTMTEERAAKGRGL